MWVKTIVLEKPIRKISVCLEKPIIVGKPNGNKNQSCWKTSHLQMSIAGKQHKS
jgi:flagellar assembly factor FliW